MAPQLVLPSTISVRNGAVTISIVCPAALPKGCSGSVRLTAVVKGKTVVLGVLKPAALKPGAKRSAPVSIRSALAKSPALRAAAGTLIRVTVTFTTTSSAGVRVTVQQVVKLRIPRLP